MLSANKALQRTLLIVAPLSLVVGVLQDGTALFLVWLASVKVHGLSVAPSFLFRAPMPALALVGCLALLFGLLVCFKASVPSSHVAGFGSPALWLVSWFAVLSRYSGA